LPEDLITETTAREFLVPETTVAQRTTRAGEEIGNWTGAKKDFSRDVDLAPTRSTRG
jgi:predicted RNA polymerase sigma factor